MKFGSTLAIMKFQQRIHPSNFSFHHNCIHWLFPHKALFVDVLSFLAARGTQQVWCSSCDAAGRRRRFQFGFADSTGQGDWSRLWTLTCWTGHGVSRVEIFLNQLLVSIGALEFRLVHISI